MKKFHVEAPSDVVFIMLINVKIVGILTFISRTNPCSVELSMKSFITYFLLNRMFYFDLCIPKTILLKDKTFVSLYDCLPSPSVIICCSPNREAFAKPNCDNVLQPEPLSCEGFSTLSPSGLTNVNTWKGMLYRHYYIYSASMKSYH